MVAIGFVKSASRLSSSIPPRVVVLSLYALVDHLGTRSLTPSNAAFRAAFTRFSVDLGERQAPPSCGPVLSFSRAISYAKAAFSLVSNTPMYRDFPAKYNCACCLKKEER